MAVLTPVPTDKFTTDRLPGAAARTWSATNSSASKMPDTVPSPAQLSTRTMSMRAPLAAPYNWPATMDAVRVPWPLQSVESELSPNTEYACSATPSNSLWLYTTPESNTYTSTPAPSWSYAYRLLRGSSTWSSRSNPHDAKDWMAPAAPNTLL